MSRDALREAINRQPFESFRVVMSNGRAYEVRHPDAAMLLRRFLVVMPAESGDAASTSPGRLSLRPIASIEDLREAA